MSSKIREPEGRSAGRRCHGGTAPGNGTRRRLLGATGYWEEGIGGGMPCKAVVEECGIRARLYWEVSVE
jgi:hypothetical protein